MFRVWAPHAGSVSVVGDFCAWDPTAHPMRRLDGGIWETEVAGLSEYDTYKFAVTAQSGAVTFKADPYAFHAETRNTQPSGVRCAPSVRYSSVALPP